MGYADSTTEYCAVAVEGESANQIWVECIDGDAHLSLERFDISWAHEDEIDPEDTELANLASGLTGIEAEVAERGCVEITPDDYLQLFSVIDNEEYIDIEARDCGERCNLEVTGLETIAFGDTELNSIPRWEHREIEPYTVNISLLADPIEYARAKIAEPFARASLSSRGRVAQHHEPGLRTVAERTAAGTQRLSGIDAAIGAAKNSAASVSSQHQNTQTRSVGR